MRKLLELDFDTIFCAHRGIVTDAKRTWKAKLEYFEELVENTRDLAERGVGPGRITRKLLGREDLTWYVTASHYSKRNLINGCLACAG